MSQTLRTVGGALGTAWLVTVMTNKSKSVATDMVVAGHVDPTKDQAKMLDITQHATVAGINHAFLYAVWLTIAALALSFFIRKTKPQRDFTEPAPQPAESSKASASV